MSPYQEILLIITFEILLVILGSYLKDLLAENVEKHFYTKNYTTNLVCKSFCSIFNGQNKTIIQALKQLVTTRINLEYYINQKRIRRVISKRILFSHNRVCTLKFLWPEKEVNLKVLNSNKI